MLRRATFFSQRLPIPTTTFFASAAHIATAQRNIVVFTQQNDILRNNAKHLGFKSPVWVEAEDDLFWTAPLTKLKPGEPSTQIRISRTFEYFNLSCLLDGPALEKDLPPATEPSSFRSQRSFSPKVGAELNRCAKRNHWTSPYFLTRGECERKNYRLKTGATSAVVHIPLETRVVNAEQFEKPELIARCPLNGSKLIPFGTAWRQQLQAVLDANPEWPTGLFFSRNQLRSYGLESELVVGVKPILLSVSDKRRAQAAERSSKQAGEEQPQRTIQMVLYNAEQLVDAEKILHELQRFPVDDHCYLLSGKVVGGKPEEVENSGSKQQQQKQDGALPSIQEQLNTAGFKSKYWIARHDLESKKYALKAKAQPTVVSRPVYNQGALGHSLRFDDDLKIEYFSVHSLSPLGMEKAFKLAGTFVS